MLRLSGLNSLHPGLVFLGFVLGLAAALRIVPLVSPPPPRPAGHRLPTPGNMCMINLKNLAMVSHMYRDDYDGKFPPPKTWNDALKHYVRDDSMFRCPSVFWTRQPTYAMNSLLEGVEYGDVIMHNRTVLFFESKPGKNRAGGRELIPYSPRLGHKSPGGRYYPVCFVAGNASMVFTRRADHATATYKPPIVEDLNWRPDYEEEGYLHPSRRR